MTSIGAKRYILLLLGFIFICFIIFINEGEKYHVGVLLTSFIISVFSLNKMFRLDGRPYSLNKIFYIFVFFFLGIAPALQFKHNVSFWGADFLRAYDYLLTNIVLIISIILYEISYKYFFSKSFNKKYHFKFFRRIPVDNQNAKWSLIVVSLSSFIVFFYSQGFNIIALLVRGGVEHKSNFLTTGSFELILNIFIRPLPVVSLIVYRFLYNKFSIWEAFLLLIILFSNAPTGMPRFQAAALYIPILISYIKPLSKNINFSLGLSVGLLVLFPILNIFRKFKNFHIYKSLENNFLLSGNFDSYHNFAIVIKNKVITYGEQLLGVLLFFIPRSIWSNKPVGSGHQAAETLGLRFPNISMNYFGEGFINFGYIGVIFFALLLGYFNSLMDKKYWKTNQLSIAKIVYLFLLGMEFFILRGDLMSSFSYTVGIICSILFVYLLITNKSRKSYYL